MKFECQIFDEPLLEFGDQHSHQDPRLGLIEAGPLQAPLGDKIRVGVVGDAKTVESSKQFLAATAGGFATKAESHPNMNPNFPGLHNNNPFRCGFEIDDEACGALTKAQIDRIMKEPNHAKAVEMAVDAIMDILQTIDDSGNRPDVALVALPVALIERVWNAKSDAESSIEQEDAGGSNAPNFRGLLKAKAMPLNFPIQIIWEDVIGEKAKIPKR